eukprot:CAMPEP_0196720880 /NCGR_PEP_ID=MMETSP1091-20130531/3573_1 /TAXON_ID=302021 /ORGANISM="Rhodomonas sp., Strain CCMP768" /LENGTH=103 /DNA_ID=CAMNT_0042062227 /DNA_START=373 /DNA_END=682 /DNA_ORIENTATION=-
MTHDLRKYVPSDFVEGPVAFAVALQFCINVPRPFSEALGEQEGYILHNFCCLAAGAVKSVVRPAAWETITPEIMHTPTTAVAADSNATVLAAQRVDCMMAVRN